ncbi:MULTISPECIES: carbohydrate kinase family protein [unclassified Microbacterium]|uniref:carbohydrate kinase family protein n=1 Tax=unclassified Microbacterium TaxID=2609290 RepID=UPI0008FC8F3A|nr:MULTISPECIES: carbohydrate kinase [unclassified Microbacterium]OIU88723.1 hypothetical protein BFN01_03695 [Microbacterium sp. AR7-10]WCD93318.1 carbohydrate kinase [Microbacterium sp. nov. GSS16]
MTAGRLGVIGESLVDVIVEPSGARTARPGGSPMNVAIGAARLGLDAILVTAVGDDEYGALLRSHIEREGVTLINRGNLEGRSNHAIATLAPDGSAEYVFRVPNRVSAPVAALAEHDLAHLHVGSLTAASDEEWAGVLAAAETVRGSGTVSFDPNCRPDIGIPHEQSRARVEAFVAASDLVKASDEDIAWLYPGWDADAVAARWMSAGARLVVVTRGGRGPIGYARGVKVALQAPSVSVIDTVGAGDSFMSAMLAWCDSCGMLGERLPAELTADQVSALLGFAARAAAITCTRVGANPPTRRELADG